MFLRRVVAHARRQDWMAIAIEFVLLVLGVFLGIQVANWNVAREAKQKSRALGAHRGDRISTPGDYATIHAKLDYPCRTGLPAEAIADAARALRSDPDMLRFLRLRIADTKTRIFNLTNNDRSVMENLRTIAGVPR